MSVDGVNFPERLDEYRLIPAEEIYFLEQRASLGTGALCAWPAGSFMAPVAFYTASDMDYTDENCDVPVQITRTALDPNIPDQRVLGAFITETYGRLTCAETLGPGYSACGIILGDSVWYAYSTGQAQEPRMADFLERVLQANGM